ncbi:MAG: helix-turn-helix transcriptional regulator [Gemmatimonadaceae bacterium]
MKTTANQRLADGIAQDLVALLHRLGLAAVVRDPDTAEILASSPLAEVVMLGAEPGRVSIASVRIAGATIRVEAIPNSTERIAVELTPRQVDVADLLQHGLRNQEIGARLGISPHTVRRHVEEILRRLGVANRTQAAAELRRMRSVNGSTGGSSAKGPQR